MQKIKEGPIKYALYMTGIIALCLLFMEVTGQNKSFDSKSPLLMLLMQGAPLLIWFFGIRSKKKQLKNKLTIREGVMEGLMISLFFGVFSSLVFVFYYLFINSAILASVKQVYRMPQATNTIIIAVDVVAQFIFSLLFGAIYSAIVSYFLRTKVKKKK